jgi:Glycosyltransferase
MNTTAKEPRKLLMVTTIPITIKAFLLPYADHFRARGWRVDAMARGIGDASGNLTDRFDKLFDVQWSRNPFSPANFTQAPGQILEAVRAEAYDIVHVHTPVAAFVTRRTLRKLRRKGRPKIVYTAHGFHFHAGGRALRNTLYRRLEVAAGKWTDRLVVINEEDRRAAERYRIVPETALVQMPGIGLDFSAYAPEKITRDDVRNVRRQMGVKDEEILFTMVAEFSPGKHHQDVVEALARMERQDVHVAFAGSGTTMGQTKELAERLDVPKQVHFLGFRQDVPVLLRASRAAILSSEREGLARSLMEAACMGTPIIGSDARGVIDIVRPHRGLVYPVGDVYALRDAMLQMCEAPYPPVSPDPAWRIEHLIALHEELYANLFANGENEKGDISDAG